MGDVDQQRKKSQNEPPFRDFMNFNVPFCRQCLTLNILGLAFNNTKI